MNIPIFQVDAFTSHVFSGNPAAVCILDTWLDDHVLQCIAAENNLSETAFIVENSDNFELRWFTPTTEVTLCGHATLASAYALFHILDHPEKTIHFQTRHRGRLSVTKKKDLLEMDFPALPVWEQAPPAGLEQSLGISLEQVFDSDEDLLVIIDSEQTVRQIRPDFALLGQVDCRGVIITAQGENCDFVSRFFGPKVGINEDPVTGSAHCLLTPYWAKRLNKNSLHALQVSERGGELYCEHLGDRVKIAGRAALYLQGIITVPDK
ncbi:MAG: PhzF family phenazine biosynthesis protein [Desulfonatronovibrio sp.]|nr:PhzF family phenazine biosynthesis protein [Desulfovibrionales bacterium]